MKAEVVDGESQPPRKWGKKEVPKVFRKRGNGDPGAVAEDLDHGRESWVK